MIYKSKVPFYTFPTTLEEQEAALTTNPLMKRLIESRKSYADDVLRPIYHYVNPEAMLNDPNGLCYWQDRWHLFYQAYPPEDTRQHWGHAVSNDLIHWRDLPYCIYPNPEDKCFSGATLVEDQRVIAHYHGVAAGNMVAVSSDPLLLNWEKIGNKAVIPLEMPEGVNWPPRIFDPCIWKKDGTYFSLSAGTKPEGPAGKPIRANFLLKSNDLKHWEYLHPFVENDQYSLIGDDGACPYFWPIGNKHMLLFFSHMSGGQYLLGDYDKKRDKFVVTHGAKFNFGPYGPSGVHAPSATPDGEDIIVIFNMNPGKPTLGWNQIMTLPRRLSLTGKDQISIEPAGDIESLRRDHLHFDSMIIPANQETLLEGVSGNTIELIAEIDPMQAPMVELNVLRSLDREEYTRISFFKNRGYRDQVQKTGTVASVISLDTSYSSTASDVNSRTPETAQLQFGDDEILQLRVFVDRSVVEVFVNNRQCISARVYPEREDSLGVSIHSRGQDCKLRSLDVWQMENIYE
ncbi:MAG: Beta-fructosidase [Candidatus Moanabacter tarae]|uniref:beta-fructofuranosidase n=1 Tax=Candidatus Moanibacter tarae TaxID=2200854 RepID=A0A2Z4AD75_9BACT|nr:MAG: Beta-fructosidase [Candidatus Moanabacter tarae]|tara:strand:- start:3757 stop:5301 length:1545 start_codon:yes stop_codon:yes gene_type:complete